MNLVDACPCQHLFQCCPLCSGKKTVYVINFDRRRIEQGVLMGLSKDEDRAWVKVDGGNYNEVIDITKNSLYETAASAQRAIFKLKLAGVFNK